jgi:hypothetical protein
MHVAYDFGKRMHVFRNEWLWTFVSWLHYELIPPSNGIVLNYLLALFCKMTFMPSSDDFFENVPMIFMKGYFNTALAKNLFSCPSCGKLTLWVVVLLWELTL